MRRVAAVCMLVLFIEGVGIHPAHSADTSNTGQVYESIGPGCWVKWPPEGGILPIPYLGDPNACVDAGVKAAVNISASTVDRAGWDAYAAREDALATANAALVTAEGILAGAKDLLGVDATVSVGSDYSECVTAEGIGSWTAWNAYSCAAKGIHFLSSNPLKAQTTGMRFVDNAKVPFPYKYVDGIFLAELYASNEERTSPWRVWASGHGGSIRGMNGGKIVRMKGAVKPLKSYIEIVNATPKKVDPYSSSTVNLCLSPSIAGFSAGSICWTWDRTAGETGGYITSAETHETVWKGTPTANARAVDGIETWKVPKGEPVKFRLEGKVWYRK